MLTLGRLYDFDGIFVHFATCFDQFQDICCIQAQGCEDECKANWSRIGAAFDVGAFSKTSYADV